MSNRYRKTWVWLVGSGSLYLVGALSAGAATFHVGRSVPSAEGATPANYGRFLPMVVGTAFFLVGLAAWVWKKRVDKRLGEALKKSAGEVRGLVALLDKERAKLVAAQRMARIGNWDLKIATGALSWSAEIYEIFGLSPSEFGASYEAFITSVHPEDRVRVEAGQRAALAGEARLDLEYRLVRPDGMERVVHELADLTRNAAGEPTHLAGTVRDITEGVRAEERLRASEIRYRRLFETTKDGVLVLDAGTGLVMDANPFLIELLGFSHEEFLGKKIWELGFFKDIVANQDNFAELQEKEYIRYEDMALETSAGRRIEVEFTSNVFRMNQEKVIQCSIRDISERKRAESEIRQLNDELELRVTERTAQLATANQELEAFSTAVSHDLRVAEAADRIKSAFLATMSHELRTPLNSIIGFTGIVLMGKAGPLSPEQKKQLEMVRESAWHLLALINDVLDLSKIEAGQIEVRAEPFNLPASIDRVLAMIGPPAQKKGLLLSAEVAPALGEMVSDQRRVEQILLNLLSNAVKFTDQGKVLLTAELLTDFRPSPEAAPRPAVCVRVGDTGIGILPEDLLMLFQPFRQIDCGSARRTDGTGLGLAISGRLATLLGGEIAAASTWSQGSEFTVIIPLQKPSAP